MGGGGGTAGAAARTKERGKCGDCLQVQRGYVPLLVGREEKVMERFLVRVALFRHPFMAALLELSAREFGYRQQGVLKIPCDVEQFRWLLAALSSSALSTLDRIQEDLLTKS